MILYIIRHGETNLNAEGCLQGWIDEPLNENGRALAQVTGEALKEVPFDLLITSPLKRARETGEITARPSQEYFGEEIPVIEDDRLKEINWGSWEKLGCLETNFSIPDKNFNWFYTNAFHFEGSPDGESIADVMDRTEDFLQELIHNKDYKDKTILISTHGCAMRALLHTLYEDKTDFWQGHVPYNCAVNIVEIEEGNVRWIEKDKIYYDQSLCFDNYKQVNEK